MAFLLGDVPHSPGVVEAHETVRGADVVESCVFLVAEYHFRNPDVIPRTALQLERREVLVCGRIEAKPQVVPAYTQIHTQRVVLYEHAPRTAEKADWSLPFLSRDAILAPYMPRSCIHLCPSVHHKPQFYRNG